MKVAKRILIGLVVFVVLLVGILALAPIIFKDEIVANVKSAVNNAVNAEVDFADANVSFLRSFPDIALTVDEYSVIGIDTFAGLPLVRGKAARIDLGFWSVLAGDGNYNIDAVTLDEPDVNLLVFTPELANYLIVPESGDGSAGASDTAGTTALITLDRFELNNANLVYDDRTTETYVEINGLNATGQGDFTATVYDVVTRATAEAFTLRQAGMTYLDGVAMTADGTVNVDSDQLRYTFTDADITLNELALVLDGSIDLEENEDILFDVRYAAPANDFRQLWSMVPAAYTTGFEQVQTSGTFTLDGTVSGAYNGTTETYPGFTVNSQIAGGSVKYPDKAVAITGIDAELAVNSPGSDLDQLTVSLPNFAFTLGDDPFNGSFRLATPLSDPDVDARLNGTLDLANWAAAIPLDGVNDLAGRIVADITMNNVRQSAIEAGRYADVNLSGDLLVSNLVYVADGTPPVRVAQARADFTPQAIDLQQFTATLGSSDVSASGKIDNILAYFTPDKTMRGSIELRSNYFDADEWMTEEPADRDLSPAEAEAAVAAPAGDVFDRFDFDLDAQISELAYGTYRPTDLRVNGNIKPNSLVIESASATLQESSFDATGRINNLFDYTFGDATLTGDIDVRSGYFNVGDFMVEDAAAATTDNTATVPAGEGAIPIPENINLRVNMLADRVRYTDITMDNVRGVMLVRDGAAVIEDGRANLFGGSMGFRGAYDTAEADEPVFRFAYDMENLDFGQAFGSLNSFAILAPIGKFLNGTFSSEMMMEGRLGADLMPVLKTIDAEGLLRTANARIAAFKPLQVIGRALNVNELKENATLKNIIAAFEIHDGKVTVDPFDFSLAGIGMTLAGSHGLDTDMDYRIRAAIPREMVEGNIVGGAALSALEKLAGQAGRLGLDITPGDTLNLDIALTGSISDPKAGINLLGTNSGGGGQSPAGSVAGALQDRAEEEVRQRTDSLRALAEERAVDFRDTLEKTAAAQAERLEQAAANRLRDALGIPDTTRSIADSLDVPNVGKEAVDDVKAKLEKFNPFKRKKGEGGSK